MIFQKVQRGINVGGWLSQYEFVAKQPLMESNLVEHFRSFITQDDIRQIAEWGFDHIRLPVSGYLLYDQDKGKIRNEVVNYIDQCVSWCSTHKLNIVLDLHDLWGNVYGAMDVPMPLLTDHALKENFFKIWEELAQYFKGETRCEITFELLNEVSDASGYLWNRMYKETIRKIRKIDEKRPILVGSNGQNSVAFLPQLDLVDDPLVFYNFHYYEPQVFTHQKAHFSQELKDFDHTVTYPGDITEFTVYLENHPQYKGKYALTEKETRNDRNLMNRLLEEACKFVRYSECQLYCGEFGIIDSAPPEEGIKWLQDLLEILDKNRIGHALWNYKGLDFGLLDVNGNVVSEKLKKAVVQSNLNML